VEREREGGWRRRSERERKEREKKPGRKKITIPRKTPSSSFSKFSSLSGRQRPR
jgi:hypothetical protein